MIEHPAKEAVRSAGRGGLEAGLRYERALDALAFMLREQSRD